ncbi:MAG: L-histidine N(alpha)-methyltransferase [Terriglobales bacterium]
MIARELVAIPSFAREVEEGLSSSPKSLPSKLFYDGPGSVLFDEITRLPEYYLTRTELEILRTHADGIALAIGPNVSVVELGAGTATKTSTLLQALAGKQIRTSYFPVDISPSALDEAKAQVNARCPTVHVHPVVADFSEGFAFLKDIPGRKLVLYLGSSIGNFDPGAAVSMLAHVRNVLGCGDCLLLGTDLVKPSKILIPAYDDAQGITAQFNKNILRRLNRELGADFYVNAFRHVACWNAACSRIEMHLQSRCRQTVSLGILGSKVNFLAGERIHTENSYKYTMDMVNKMLSAAGFSLDQTWFDHKKWFALNLARVDQDLV